MQWVSAAEDSKIRMWVDENVYKFGEDVNVSRHAELIRETFRRLFSENSKG